MIDVNGNLRETAQLELPLKKDLASANYDIYPTHKIGENLIHQGFDTLATALASNNIIKLDGYVGIRFEDVREKLNAALNKLEINPVWINVEEALKEEKDIDEMIAPFLGGDDPVFGKVCNLELQDFFDKARLAALAERNAKYPIIFYGTGAGMVTPKGATVFLEISKNEIQFRSKAGSILNLGASGPEDPQKMYKRFYFVDWQVLNNYKRSILRDIDLLVDNQRTDDITWTKGDSWRSSLKSIVKGPIRVRPWFSPGAWGGHWIEEKIEGLSQNVPNYAWSFELIVPENGVILESSGYLLEFSFDFLMFKCGEEMLGEDFSTYVYEFPIRFDFLDTVEGGNLSIQCHPQKEYMKKNFGENITQEETYYILDKKEDAHVYLGFQEGVTSSQFKEALETSVKENKEIEITDYVQVFESQKHGLYLIPPGTIHSSGKNNLVLEISSTPYIYTFKMYDWLRLDLDGKPRPLNIDRGMDNLVFERAGAKVKEELISKPVVLESNEYAIIEHLPTHPEHLYDVHRLTVKTAITISTSNKVHVLSLVEGDSVEIKTEHNTAVYNYAETFVIPAATKEYTITNLTKNPIKVLKAFIK